jgi:hypothetical protein
MTAIADAPAVARLIRDFPGWQISFDPAGVIERKLTPHNWSTSDNLDELRANAGQPVIVAANIYIDCTHVPSAGRASHAS